ncbi:hypothetical protein BGZ79_005068, partial [Entomortierella chlamydospora]
MVTATISTQGLIQAPSNPTKYKKPKGFRFNFKETEKVQWRAFEDAMNIQLGDPEKMKTFGIKGLLEEDTDQIGRLRKLDIEEAWRWYSSVIMECAKNNLPGRVVGRSGVKPKSELSVLSMIRDLGRIKKLAKTAMVDDNEGVSSVRDKMVEHQVKFNTHAVELKEKTGREIDHLAPVPEPDDPKESWREWIRAIKRKW